MEIEKQLRKEEQKKNGPFVPVVTPTGTPTGTKDPGQKSTPFCSDLAFPVGKPGQQRFSNRDKSVFL